MTLQYHSYPDVPIRLSPCDLHLTDMRRATQRRWTFVKWLSKGQNYDMKRYCNVTRDPQVAYLSRQNHFGVKNGQNRCGKRSFLMFQTIIAHEMIGSPLKCFTISFS